MSNNLSGMNIQNLYPELYNQLKPYIDDAVRRFQSGQIDQNMLESIVEDILISSGLSQYMTDVSEEEEAVVPAQRMFGGFGFGNPNQFRRRPGGPFRPPGPPRPRPPIYPYPVYPPVPCPGCGWGPPITPRNLVRLLLLQQLFGV